MEYLIKQYPLDTGALEIQYIEEHFGEFPRKKTAQEIMNRLGKKMLDVLEKYARACIEPQYIRSIRSWPRERGRGRIEVSGILYCLPS